MEEEWVVEEEVSMEEEWVVEETEVMEATKAEVKSKLGMMYSRTLEIFALSLEVLS